MEPAEIIAAAIRLASSEAADNSDEYWDLIQSLRRNPTQHVFELAALCCAAATPCERAVGADIFAQLGLPDNWETGGRPFTDQSVPILRSLLTDLDEDVLTSAIHALGHPNIASAADLSGLARHPSAEVRHAVAFALDSHDAKARELLLKLMTDEDASVRD